MNIKNTLEYVSVLDPYRKNRIVDILKENKIPYSFDIGSNYTNIVITPQCTDTSKTKMLLTAHYDAVEGSFGANDNGAAIALLLQLAKYFMFHESKYQIEIVLFDKEESGHFYGSLGYVTSHVIKNTLFINFDVIGCGDHITIVRHDNNLGIITVDNMRKYNIAEFEFFPPSDAMILNQIGRLNGLEISVFHRKILIINFHMKFVNTCIMAYMIILNLLIMIL